jgi:hypothetical protein
MFPADLYVGWHFCIYIAPGKSQHVNIDRICIQKNVFKAVPDEGQFTYTKERSLHDV